MEWFTGFLLDIIKLTVAGSLVFLVIYLTIKPAIGRAQSLKLLDLKKASLKKTLPLRLQAYERMTIFIERINPASLLLRNHMKGISLPEFQNALNEEIRSEFQHNLSQQIYVSGDTWAVVKGLKDKTITLINDAVRGLPEDAGSIDLSKKILSHLASLEQDPYDAALQIIRQDTQKLF